MKICCCTVGFRNKPLKEVLDILEKIGFKYFEGLADLPTHLQPYLTGERDVTELEEILKTSKVKLVAISGAADFGVNTQNFKDEFKCLKQQIALASRLQVNILRVFVSHIPTRYITDTVWEQVLRNIKTVIPLAEEKGVKLAFENHFGITSKAEDLLRVIEASRSPNVGINFDPANFIPTGENPIRAAKILAPYIIHVHIKDCKKSKNGAYNGYDFCEIGAGFMNYFDILNTLKTNKYDGFLSLEYENIEDTERGANEGLQNLQKLLSEI